MILKARAYALCRECGDAVKKLEELAGERDPEVSSEALYRLSRRLLYSGRYQEAAEKFAEAARLRPSGESSNDALDMAILIKRGMRSGDSRVLNMIASASQLEAEGRPGMAADTLSLIADKYPGSPLVPYAVLWSSRLKIAVGREGEAERELEAMSEDYPNSIYAPRGMELLAGIIEAGRPEEALELLRTVINRYPSDPYLDRVRRKYMQLAKQLERPEVEQEGANMESVLLEKAPLIAVYAPPNKQPWDDAVMMALEYADIPYDQIYDGDVLGRSIMKYDWIHLHHEDFTGQYGKFYASYRNSEWYVKQQILFEKIAASLGYQKVSEEKKAVAEVIREYVRNGGFLFAMCSACDSFDIALAARGVDIVPSEYDHDGIDPGYSEKLDFSRCFAFENFSLITDPYVYEY
ncbi:MAG: tetratricopeptide repeat protein, partial [Candidatus Latescibacteria bacterium]|nr:tetratricopeptide repeat protein [Candidatus Latescibacterota bacterium]